MPIRPEIEPGNSTFNPILKNMNSGARAPTIDYDPEPPAVTGGPMPEEGEK